MLLIVYFDVYPNNLIKRLRELSIPFDIVKYNKINLLNDYRLVILTGSDKRILRDNYFPLLDQLIKRPNLFIIGICFGFQYLALKTCGEITENELFKGRRMARLHNLYFNHYDRVIQLSDQWTVSTRIDDFINIAGTENLIGFQFHPEKDKELFHYYVLPFVKFALDL
jgi:GMP synthase-like glutamine amidotransferase